MQTCIETLEDRYLLSAAIKADPAMMGDYIGVYSLRTQDQTLDKGRVEINITRAAKSNFFGTYSFTSTRGSVIRSKLKATMTSASMFSFTIHAAKTSARGTVTWGTDPTDPTRLFGSAVGSKWLGQKMAHNTTIFSASII